MTNLALLANLSNSDKIGLISVLIAAAGILVILGGIIYKSGKNAQRLKHIEDDIKDTVKPELKSLRKTMVDEAKEIRNKLDDILKTMSLKQVSQSQSPRTLNEFGKQVLEQSGIRAIIEPKLDHILDVVKAAKPENAYQVQELLLDIVQNLKTDTSLKNAIEQAAFKSGVSVETVLLVGGIDIRDTVLQRLNMKPDDIDVHKSKSKE